MEIQQDNNTDRWKGLRTRIIGALLLAMLVILCVATGGFFFGALILVAAAIMLKEWEALTKAESVNIKLAGYPLLLLPCACLLWLRSLPTGAPLVLTLIAIIAATDIGAYFTGKRFGKTKLAPVISPNKTWEGLGGGVFAAMLVAALCLPVGLPLFARLMTGISLAILAQSGDILESSVKRRAGVKDSGKLIPGHGGLLDRADGYLLTTPVFALLVHFWVL